MQTPYYSVLYRALYAVEDVDEVLGTLEGASTLGDGTMRVMSGFSFDADATLAALRRATCLTHPLTLRIARPITS